MEHFAFAVPIRFEINPGVSFAGKWEPMKAPSLSDFVYEQPRTKKIIFYFDAGDGTKGDTATKTSWYAASTNAARSESLIFIFGSME